MIRKRGQRNALTVLLNRRSRTSIIRQPRQKRRTDVLQQWLRGRIAAEERKTLRCGRPPLASALNFQRLVQLTQLKAFSARNCKGC